MIYYTETSNHTTNVIRKWVYGNRQHLVAWIIFIFYESIMVGLYSGRFSNFWDYLTHYALNISLFYTHSNLVLPKSLTQRGKSYVSLTLYILCEITIYVVLITITDLFLLNYTNLLDAEHMILDTHFYVGTIIRGSYFIGFSTGYYYLIHFLDQSKRAVILEQIRLNHIISTQKIEYELAKSQINPHFLFNTLDFIYHGIRKTAPETAEAIATLSSMMRFNLDNLRQNEFILLADEIEQVENLIYLHQIRKREKLNIQLIYDESITKINFTPLVILTLTENIFKHGDLSAAWAPAVINIYLIGDTLFIETSNLIHKEERSGGLKSGLSNISKRLQHSYGHDVNLQSFTTYKYFRVKISVKNILMKAPY
jgi:two-component system LytT family sensor kinase